MLTEVWLKNQRKRIKRWIHETEIKYQKRIKTKLASTQNTISKFLKQLYLPQAFVNLYLKDIGLPALSVICDCKRLSAAAATKEARKHCYKEAEYSRLRKHVRKKSCIFIA